MISARMLLVRTHIPHVKMYHYLITGLEKNWRSLTGKLLGIYFNVIANSPPFLYYFA